MQNNIDKLLAYADELLNAAEQETERAEEDVVTHLVCVNSRQSTANYLAGFLILRNVPVVQPITIQGLLDQCREIDARFEEIDLSPMYCRCETDDSNYCMDLAQVRECMQIAQWARSVVMEDTPGY